MAVSSFHLTRAQLHFGWSRDFDPVVAVPSGAELRIDIQDASAGQIQVDSTASAIADLDFARVNPATGPVYVEGARPGDVLQVDLLAMDPSTWGWTAQIPGFGLLADQFPDPWLHVSRIDARGAHFAGGVVVPVSPFCGVLGVAPAEPGVHSSVPPRRVGGNLDIKQLGPGATLYLPVEVEGALFGAGDTHAAQGDGEVCGTAIESSMAVTLRLTVRRDLKVAAPEFELRRPLERAAAAAAGYTVTTGVADDLTTATRQAVERMIVRLGERHGLSAQDAYGLCSIAVDLKISEVVDAPNWVVSAFCPNDIFT
jgi:acetamidase/formamidase